jgi:hypothetical protein
MWPIRKIIFKMLRVIKPDHKSNIIHTMQMTTKEEVTFEDVLIVKAEKTSNTC